MRTRRMAATVAAFALVAPTLPVAAAQEGLTTSPAEDKAADKPVVKPVVVKTVVDDGGAGLVTAPVQSGVTAKPAPAPAAPVPVSTPKPAPVAVSPAPKPAPVATATVTAPVAISPAPVPVAPAPTPAVVEAVPAPVPAVVEPVEQPAEVTPVEAVTPAPAPVPAEVVPAPVAPVAAVSTDADSGIADVVSAGTAAAVALGAGTSALSGGPRHARADQPVVPAPAPVPAYVPRHSARELGRVEFSGAGRGAVTAVEDSDGLHITGDVFTPIGSGAVDLHAVNRAGVVTVTNQGAVHTVDTRPVAPAVEWVAQHTPRVDVPETFTVAAGDVTATVTTART